MFKIVAPQAESFALSAPADEQEPGYITYMTLGVSLTIAIRMHRFYNN